MQNGVISIRSSLYTDVLSEYSRKRGILSMQNGVIPIRSSLYTYVLSEYSRKRGRLSGPFPIVSC